MQGLSDQLHPRLRIVLIARSTESYHYLTFQGSASIHSVLGARRHITQYGEDDRQSQRLVAIMDSALALAGLNAHIGNDALCSVNGRHRCNDDVM